MTVLGRRGFLAILLAAVLVLFTATASASVSDDWPGLLDENVIDVDVDIPVTVSGVSAAILGDATSESAPEINTGSPPPPPPPPADDSGHGGILSGNSVSVDADIPVTVCGVAVAVVGNASGSCSPDVNTGSPAPPAANGGHGDGGILSGNTVAVDADAPITVCGVSAAVLGDASASCSPDVNTTPPVTTPPVTTPPVTTPPVTTPPVTTPPTQHLPTSQGPTLHGVTPAAMQFSGSGLASGLGSAVGRLGDFARDIAGLPFTGSRDSGLIPVGVALVLAGVALDAWARRRALAR